MENKEASTEKKTSKPKVYNWTAKRKEIAHNELIQLWNKNELQKRATVRVEYLPDGTALCKTIGRVKTSYSHKMPVK